MLNYASGLSPKFLESEKATDNSCFNQEIVNNCMKISLHVILQKHWWFRRFFLLATVCHSIPVNWDRFIKFMLVFQVLEDLAKSLFLAQVSGKIFIFSDASNYAFVGKSVRTTYRLMCFCAALCLLFPSSAFTHYWFTFGKIFWWSPELINSLLIFFFFE